MFYQKKQQEKSFTKIKLNFSMLRAIHLLWNKLLVCVCVCVCVCVGCVFVFVCVRVCGVCMCVCACVYDILARVCACAYMCLYTRACVCVSVYVSIREMTES